VVNILTGDFQDLSDRYFNAIKRIRLIRKAGDDIVITPQPGKQQGPALIGVFRNDFETLTGKHARELKEVRVLHKEGGASQFFPRGTPESDVWKSIITKEELDAK
jgi:hypothetical protein